MFPVVAGLLDPQGSVFGRNNLYQTIDIAYPLRRGFLKSSRPTAGDSSTRQLLFLHFRNRKDTKL